ncbi:MAG: hypothetical protein O2799_10250 [Planctomycetota bacterium]|nr:hypothetical protein [Planctomycetota bacterium]
MLKSIKLLLLGSLAVSAPAQTPTWESEFIGAWPTGWPGNAVVTGYNDAGLVGGYVTLSLAHHAWSGEPGAGFTLLPVPAGTNWSEVQSINSLGWLGGTARVSGVWRALLWTPGPSGYQVQLLPAAANGWLPASVTAMNDHGDLVGRYGPVSRPYHWTAATGTVGLPYPAWPHVPVAINNERQVLVDTLRMDLDTLVIEDLGNPTGLGYSFLFTELGRMNDAGDVAGVGITASSSSNVLPVSHTDQGGWEAWSTFPMQSGGVSGLASSGDLVYMLNIAGLESSYLHVEGVGSMALGSIVDPGSTAVTVASIIPSLTRGGRLLAYGTEVASGQFGLALLKPAGFDDLGGASAGSLGAPVLGAFGDRTPGSPTRLRLSSASKGSVAFLVLSITAVPLPLFGGVLHPAPLFGLLPVPVDPSGRVDLTFPWPALPVGVPLVLQAGILDRAAVGGVALSNALLGPTQ